MSSVNKVLLAIYLHEISPAHGDWYPWRKLSPEGREGWLVQAERLLSIYDITPKGVGVSAIVPSPESDTRERVPEQVPSVGRIVRYVLRLGLNAGESRPAVVVAVWGPTCVNLQVFLDGSNDTGDETADGVRWAQCVYFDPTGTGFGTWHWPERVTCD
jgi:hypothetical protein